MYKGPIYSYVSSMAMYIAVSPNVCDVRLIDAFFIIMFLCYSQDHYKLRVNYKSSLHYTHQLANVTFLINFNTKLSHRTINAIMPWETLKKYCHRKTAAPITLLLNFCDYSKTGLTYS